MNTQRAARLILAGLSRLLGELQDKEEALWDAGETTGVAFEEDLAEVEFAQDWLEETMAGLIEHYKIPVDTASVLGLTK